MESKPSTIQEAPSLADITSAEDRVGKVDFTAKLGDRMSEADEAARADSADGVVSLTSMVRPQRPAGDDDGDDDGPKMPFILPPAKVDAAMTAEAERTKLEIATARGELVDDDPEDDETDEPDDSDGGTDTAADAVESAPDDTAVTPVGSNLSDLSPDDSEPVEPEKRSGPPEGLVISGVADLDAVAAAVAHLEAEEAGRADAAEVLRLEAETEAAARAAEEALARAALIDAAELEALREERAEHDAPLHTVTQVADTVVAAMRRINEAHERHVESLEVETARRCELLTAQAELDAELIRLHARREAHAIISAARARTGEHDTELVETDQLGEIGETFSRFAETIETTVAPGPASPDHLRKS